MRFVPGMTCCKPERVAVGLECDVADMVCCAAHSCQSAGDSGRANQLRRLASIFPPDRLVQIAQVAHCVADALPILAQQCAALPDRATRRCYAAVVERVLNESDYKTFLDLHAEHWARSRGITHSGDSK
ncbi:hypothetical protein D7S86_24585 [Pararobbsia silviterrae]|uniref:Uncharacterized protein n=1 Tax=Pararobbsia silviterrae TaxID=1792498 RepID=A0A494X886_9BURK|nr:hypothetical protein D7S86_24585 [Pararobbsia silviterrae]